MVPALTLSDIEEYQYRADLQILFHGTTSIYEDSIEKNGFPLNFHPFAPEDTKFIKRFVDEHCKKLSISSASFVMNYRKHLSGSGAHFSHRFATALNYSSMPGGETVKAISNAAKAMLKLPLQLSDKMRLESIAEKYTPKNTFQIVYVVRVGLDQLKNLQKSAAHAWKLKMASIIQCHYCVAERIDWVAVKDILPAAILGKYYAPQVLTKNEQERFHELLWIAKADCQKFHKPKNISRTPLIAKHV